MAMGFREWSYHKFSIRIDGFYTKSINKDKQQKVKTNMTIYYLLLYVPVFIIQCRRSDIIFGNE